MNKIDNAAIICQLFKSQPQIKKALSHTTPYLKITNDGTKLFVRCPDFMSMKTLLTMQEIITVKVFKVIGYEVCLEYEEINPAKLDKSIKGKNMAVTAESSTLSPQKNYSNGSGTKLFKLQNLVETTGSSAEEIKIMLAHCGGVIYPRIDGSEMVAESFFDLVLLNWAKSLKSDQEELLIPENRLELEQPSNKPRKQSQRILKLELTINDIAKHKRGSMSGSPILNSKGLETTLTNFFSKVKLEDTSLVDAISAFIEGTSEFGLSLRKKLMSAYKKFFPGANIAEIEALLIIAAKAYLESATKTPTEPVTSDQ